MSLIGIAALAVVLGVSLSLWLAGNRFARRYVELKRSKPPLTWMFRRTDDPQLEEDRRFALRLLPIDIVAGVVYVLQT